MDSGNRGGEITQHSTLNVNLYLRRHGELGDEMRNACDVVFDADRSSDNQQPITDNQKPRATFAGFLNQTDISRAYVAADVLVLPSDYGETWGLVVNEAMASGLGCIVSDHCGCSPDLGRINGNAVYKCGDVKSLAYCLGSAPGSPGEISGASVPSFQQTLAAVKSLSARNDSKPDRMR